MAENEKSIKPPAFPLTVRLNQVITDFYFDHFTRKYLAPLGLVPRITSKDRTPEHNAAVGGAANSAHLHGLAVDFQLFKDGRRLSPEEEKRMFQAIIKPKWPGFALDEIESKNHIHVNLSRAISVSTAITTASIGGIVAVPIVKNLLKSSKGGTL